MRWASRHRIAATVIAVVLVGLGLMLGLFPKQWLFDGSVLEVFLMIIPATAFPILYACFFPWYRTGLGQALMTKAVGLALLIDVSVVYLIFGDDYFLREHVRFCVYTLILIGLWYQMVMIIKIKIDSARTKEAKGDSEAEHVVSMEDQ